MNSRRMGRSNNACASINEIDRKQHVPNAGGVTGLQKKCAYKMIRSQQTEQIIAKGQTCAGFSVLLMGKHDEMIISKGPRVASCCRICFGPRPLALEQVYNHLC